MVQDNEKRTQAEFTRQASTMAEAALFNDAGVLARMRAAAQLRPESRVLDVACGPGIVVEALAPFAAEVVGCDLTPAMLAKARARCATRDQANVRWVLGRAQFLPFGEAQFDVVVARSALHHFAAPLDALREMARVLRPGGRVVNVDVLADESPEQAALHNALETLRDPSHVRMLPKSELHQLMAQSGLRVEQSTEWVNQREFEEWLRIANAPERAAPLKVLMAALARAGEQAGIQLRLEGETVRFEHRAALTVASKAD